MAGTSPRASISPERLEEIVTGAVVAAMTAQRQQEREQLLLLSQSVEAVSETVKKLSCTVFGNGKEGLATKVDRLEQARANSPMRGIGLEVMKTLIIGVVFAVITLIVTHGIPIK